MSDRSTMRQHGAGVRRNWTVWLVAGVLTLGVLVWFATRGSQGAEDAAEAQAGAAAPSAADCPNGKSLYVAVDGTSQNDGSMNAPLDLATALSSAGPARPCDTVWLRGGTYKGAFQSSIRGTENAPIVVRQMAGERATIDSAPEHAPALSVGGEYVWFWGIEITNSDPNRASAQTENWPSDLSRASGVLAGGAHLKFINMVVHDMTRGFELGDAIDVEVYGSLIYYNGWIGPDGKSTGHGIDTRNRVGQRRLVDNVIFDQFSHGISAYGASPIVGMTLIGNILFNNGSISKNPYDRDVLIGGAGARAPQLRANATYGGAQTNIGYGAGCSDADLQDNYLASTTPLLLTDCTGIVKGNTIFGNVGPLSAAFPDNTYQLNRPSGVLIKMRPNAYESGRANVAIYNWDKKPEVEVDLTGTGLVAGDQFEVRDVRNFYANPIATGQFGSQSKISIRVDSMTGSAPVGAGVPTPAHTAPEFLAVVIVKPHRSRATNE